MSSQAFGRQLRCQAEGKNEHLPLPPDGAGAEADQTRIELNKDGKMKKLVHLMGYSFCKPFSIYRVQSCLAKLSRRLSNYITFI